MSGVISFKKWSSSSSRGGWGVQGDGGQNRVTNAYSDSQSPGQSTLDVDCSWAPVEACILKCKKKSSGKKMKGHLKMCLVRCEPERVLTSGVAVERAGHFSPGLDQITPVFCSCSLLRQLISPAACWMSVRSCTLLLCGLSTPSFDLFKFPSSPHFLSSLPALVLASA